MKKLCVYCGSGGGVDPRFKDDAITLGRSLAQSDIGLIYGGGGNGLMGTVARACRDSGGHVTGIIPTSLVSLENALDGLSEKHVVANMHERKMLMSNLADGFVALAGGVGTLEELVEQLTWGQLGHHDKPVYIVNTGGYWNLLLELFEKMRSEQFIRPGLETHYTVFDDVSAIVPAFRKVKRRPASVGHALVEV